MKDRKIATRAGGKFSVAIQSFLILLCWQPICTSQEESPIELTAKMGPVSARVQLAPRTPVIGDTLELNLEVTAERGVEVLMPEFGEALGRFQIVDFLPREKRNEDGSTLFTQRYRLQSPPSGDHAIPPILIEFVDRRPGEKQAPDGLDAYELLTERINFRVESVLVDDATVELNPPLGRLANREAEPEPTSSLWTYLGIGLGATLLASVLWLGITLYRKRVIRKSAYEIARRQLDRLLEQDFKNSNEIDSFYVSLTRIVRQYLENRFELRAPDLTTEEFLVTVADSAELSADHKKLLNEFLRHADLVKFARLEPSGQDVDEAISRATRFLEETRENAPLMIDPEVSPADSHSGQVANQKLSTRPGEDDV